MLQAALKTLWYEISRSFCRVCCALFFSVRVYGLENIPERGAFLLVSNHQSYLDPVLCGLYIRRQLSYIARDSLFGNPFFGWLIYSVNAIPVRRGCSDVAAMKKVIAQLRQGRGVCLFPEATRTSDGRIVPFKPGLSLLCRRGNAPVVPAVIDGAFECWPRHKKIFSVGSRIAICYGKAISVEQIANMGDDQLATELTETIRQMQNDCRRKLGRGTYDY